MNKWEDETGPGDDDEEVSHPFDSLTPSFLIDAVESLGFYCDGRLFPLNSYENRVYQVVFVVRFGFEFKHDVF